MANEQNLKPYPKGVSGNPAGKPKGTEHSKTRLKRILELVQKKRNPITGEDEEFTVLELMDMQMIAKALKGDQRAYQEVIDRLEGKPKQSTEVEVSGGMTINWDEKKTYVENKGSL
jgi:benzoyl-CoA reductase/2-hydroxyglutaryl-CoA dehydratase subunit BcrC/BadD/HgdB